MLNFKELKEIKGDASFRKFYRNKKNHSIVVYAIKDKVKNLLIYDAINKILLKNKILAPKLLGQNYKNNYIEVEDFGDDLLNKLLKLKKTNKILTFKKILKILIKLQSIKDINFKKKYQKEIKKLISKLNFKNDTFVHRDFHVSNLINFKNNIALIDSQDALIGNKAYDLASLIDDVRIKTSNKLKNQILNDYLKTLKKNEIKKFINDFEILSVLRNLKIIGIFTRLAVRDNKKKYTKMIPYAWKMINYRIKNNKEFKNLKSILENYFPKLIN